MITFGLTEDDRLIRGVVTHPAVFPFMFSDGGPDEEQYHPVIGGGFVYIAARMGGELAGLFICIPQTGVCWEIHACLLPHARGAIAIRIYREGLAWLAANTPCRKAIGYTPRDNRPALFVALRAGMKKIGINTKSILRDGVLRDQVILGKELVKSDG